MSPAVAWFWRAVTLVVFIVMMVAVTKGADWFANAIPTGLMLFLSGTVGGLCVGMLIGTYSERKRAFRP